jgi:hypothetical protein
MSYGPRWWCLQCGAWVSAGHLTSIRHLKKEWWLADSTGRVPPRPWPGPGATSCAFEAAPGASEAAPGASEAALGAWVVDLWHTTTPCPGAAASAWAPVPGAAPAGSAPAGAVPTGSVPTRATPGGAPPAATPAPSATAGAAPGTPPPPRHPPPTFLASSAQAPPSKAPPVKAPLGWRPPGAGEPGAAACRATPTADPLVRSTKTPEVDGFHCQGCLAAKKRLEDLEAVLESLEARLSRIESQRG